MEQLAISHLPQGALRAVQTPPEIGLVLFLPEALALGGMIVCVVMRKWRLAGGALVAFCTFVFAGAFAKPGPVYQVTVTPSRYSVAWQRTEGQVEQPQVILNASEIETANVETRQTGGRVFILKKDGGLVYPLGDSFHMGEPEQFAVSDSIRAMLGAEVRGR